MLPSQSAVLVDDRSGRPATVGGSEGRTLWADVAKGVCILLVVLWHVIMKHYLQITWRLPVPIPGAWGALGEQLLPLRMPVFFTISGMLAVGAVGRPWRVLGRSKVAKFSYLYALWLLIHTAVLEVTPGFRTDRADGPVELLEQLTISPSNLWYLLALAVYFTIAKAVRRFPKAPVLAAAFALSAAASAQLLATPGNRAGMYQNLLFFLIGLYFRPAIERLAAESSGRRLVVAGGAFAGVLGVMAVLHVQTWYGIWPLASVVAMVFGVTAAAMLCRWRAVANALAKLGRRTLPIYVIHMPVLALLHRLTVGQLSGLDSQWQVVVAVVEPVVLTAFVAWTCLLLHRGLQAVGAYWLFELPTVPRSAVRRLLPAGRQHLLGRRDRVPGEQPRADSLS